jgi:putative sterol carrier protein
LSDDTLVGLADGSVQAMKAFMSGELKVTGNIMLAQKLEGLFAEQKKKAAGAKSKL